MPTATSGSIAASSATRLGQLSRPLRHHDAGRARPRRHARRRPVDRANPCRRKAADDRACGRASARHWGGPARNAATALVVKHRQASNYPAPQPWNKGDDRRFGLGAEDRQALCANSSFLPNCPNKRGPSGLGSIAPCLTPVGGWLTAWRPENQVRTRLPAGGRQIRTIVPAKAASPPWPLNLLLPRTQVPFIPPERCRGPQGKLRWYMRLRKRRVRA
jgi:hypothetical protein